VFDPSAYRTPIARIAGRKLAADILYSRDFAANLLALAITHAEVTLELEALKSQSRERIEELEARVAWLDGELEEAMASCQRKREKIAAIKYELVKIDGLKPRFCHGCGRLTAWSENGCIHCEGWGLLDLKHAAKRASVTIAHCEACDEYQLTKNFTCLVCGE
jgi:hypothetical protein